MTHAIGTTTWSTDLTDERERFSFWREMVCRNVFNVGALSQIMRKATIYVLKAHAWYRDIEPMISARGRARIII